MSRWLALAPLLVLLALGGLFGLYALNRNPQVQPQALVGKAAPAFSLSSLDDGAPTPIVETPGKGPVLVNFFASWCAPCEIEHPVLMSLKRRGVAITGVAYKDAPANTQAFLARLGDPFARRLIDRDGAAGIDFGVTGVPETYLIGADGIVIAKHTGPLSAAAAQSLLSRTAAD
ncbi:DsbE family thiol:disulfide interchange protein [Phenylobacterium immobile]|uniref:DsbE family thiol:disulfide interchange protein n=1 Tax=Phenylobacterium immobile TaxID=21 RepID=UPI000B2D4CB2|nr:DsbE family thiol:disulfide interchange protein [Phenylobacterium immobile]